MEKCKFCEAELEENSSVCPKCGADNAAAEVPAAQPAKEKLSGGKTILALAAVVVVLIALMTLVLKGQKPADIDAAAESAAASEETEVPEETAETVEATIPADGNPDDVTCKGTYTAADEDVIAARDTVVATAGDRELTLSQLQVFYWMEVRNFMSQYGAYAAYFGLDIQQPLDTQPCEVMDTPMTWQQYFLNAALNTWTNYSAMRAEAEANGFELTELQRQALDEIEEQLNSAALENGFESADDMIHSSLGSAADMADYSYFMRTYFMANGYYGLLAESVHPTQEDLDAFFEEHADGYAQSGITKDTKSVDVRHILILPEGADSSSIFSEEFSEEAWTAGEAAASALLDEWLAGDATEESFAALANEHSQDPGSNTNGGLYQGVTEGQMVQTFNDWCFDAARQTGDTGVVRTDYGFHVMYFVGSTPLWQQYVESDFIGEVTNGKAAEIAAQSPVTVKYDAILLGLTELT